MIQKPHIYSSWRHWGCTTNKIISNFKKSFDNASELDGYDELKPEDQERIDKAWEDGAVADEDIPETARKPPKDDDDDEDAAEKPKKKRAPAKKAKVSTSVGTSSIFVIDLFV